MEVGVDKKVYLGKQTKWRKPHNIGHEQVVQGAKWR
jgi:hypothetical protein